MKLICLGDSLTFGYGVPRRQRWTSVLSREGGHEVVNQGINGDTTGGMLARLGTDVLAEIQRETLPKRQLAVFLMGGSNDIMFSGTDDAARANVAAIVHRVAAKNIRMVIGVPPPIDWLHVPREWAQLSDVRNAARLETEYAAWLRTFCQTFALPCADFSEDFLSPGGQPLAELFFDGLHPTAEGHLRMARRMEDVLAGL